MKHLKQVWQVATVYVGTIVGAGFATGREIVEFFSQFGLPGLLGILLAGYLFIYFGYKMMILTVRIQARDYFEYNRWLFGRRFSGLVNGIFFCMLFGVTAVMLAGAGEVFFQQYGLPKFTGMVLTAVLSIIVMSWGFKGLSIVNMVIVPTMLLFNLLLAFLVLRHSFSWDYVLEIPQQPKMWRTIVLPFAYVALNLSLAQPVFVPLAKEVKEPLVIKHGAFLGGALLTIILILSHLILVTFSELQAEGIPTAAVMKQVAPFLGGLYLLIIFGEIFTSIIGNAYGLERQLHRHVRVSSVTIYIFFFIGALAIAQFEYAKLLSLLYPLFGYLSVLFLLLLFIKKTD